MLVDLVEFRLMIGGFLCKNLALLDQFFRSFNLSNFFVAIFLLGFASIAVFAILSSIFEYRLRSSSRFTLFITLRYLWRIVPYLALFQFEALFVLRCCHLILNILLSDL